MDKTFEPKAIEAKWYPLWEDRGWFAPQGNGEPYCILIPPPNVTGTLHMGHAFQHTIMDALIRHARMSGKDTLWQPGTDHAGIATQMVVERNLKLAGEPTRAEMGREKFVEKVWEWKHYSGGTIESQIRRMGSSVDWSRNAFTMSPEYSRGVIEHFVRLYEDGLIYRGKRLVNWDPVLLTAISDLEVVSEEENGKLWHLRYPLADGSGHLIVATTRPETMLGDTAVAVHPEDERHQKLIGKMVKLPLCDREIPVIADDFVDREFGSGVVKITPAHDFNDYAVGQRHGLPMIGVLTKDARINDNAPASYRGLDRFAARKKIVADLQVLELVEKIDDHKLKVPRGDRSGAVLEPFLTDQWFVDLTREQRHDGKPGPGGMAAITRPALEAFSSGRIKFIPDNWINTYNQWLNNIQDWCISRQLWWGHRIPAWYDASGNIYVGRDETEVRAKHKLDASIALTQDNDVFDTWFSSDIWPMTTLGWPVNTGALKKFYPSSVLVTGFDIIFFWVARMVMMGQYFMKAERPEAAPEQWVPFREVYITGLVRDPEGNKMSKSKGNVLDPLDVVEGITLDALVKKRITGLMQPETAPKIEAKTRKDYPKGIAPVGVDALRFTFAALATNGRDIRFDAGRAEGYRNFCNKIWNASAYVLANAQGQDVGLDQNAPVTLSVADRWIISRLQSVEAEIATQITAYRFDLVAQSLYQFIWNEYCDWYIELSKPALKQADEAAQRGTRRTLVRVLETWLRLLHPIMPFITEEIWQRVAPLAAKPGETIMLQPYPAADNSRHDPAAESEMAWLQGFILGIRQIRGEMDISPGKPLPVLIANAGARDRELVVHHRKLIDFLARVEDVRFLAADEEAPEAATALLGEMRILVPMAGLIDKNAEIARLQKQIEARRKNISSSQGKLENSQFVDNAPAAVVEKERANLAEHQRAVEELQTQLGRIQAL